MQDPKLTLPFRILDALIAVDGEEAEDNHNKRTGSFEHRISLINTDQGVAIQIDAAVFAQLSHTVTELELIDRYTITFECNTTRIHGNIERLPELISLLNHKLKWISPEKNIELDGQLLFHFAKKKSDPVDSENILFSSKGKNHVMKVICHTREKARELCHEIFLGKFETAQTTNSDYKVGSTANIVIICGSKKNIRRAIHQLHNVNKCIAQETYNGLLEQLDALKRTPASSLQKKVKAL
ncbi:MAG TPA: hypothetical protein VGV92_01870 [Gammaproteobacteria bacterium]|nr:hypothetical protein [Gammaproteobacteria bacterium]